MKDGAFRRLREYRTLKFITAALVFITAFLTGKLFYEESLKWLSGRRVKVKVITRDFTVKTLPPSQALTELKKAKFRASGIKNLKKRNDLLSQINAQIKWLERFYPTLWAGNVLKRPKSAYPAVKNWEILFSYAFFVVLFGVIPLVFFHYYDRRKLRHFFYQVGKKEEPIRLGRKINFINWPLIGVSWDTVFGKIFNGPSSYLWVMRIFDHQLIADRRIYSDKESPEEWKLREQGKVVLNLARLNKDMRDVAWAVAEDALKEGLVGEDGVEHFKALIALALFHRAAGYFGNVPVESLIVAMRKDNPTARAFVSNYYYGKVPLSEFMGVQKTDVKEAEEFLTAFHGFRKEKSDFFKYLLESYCQIPVSSLSFAEVDPEKIRSFTSRFYDTPESRAFGVADGGEK
jgi:hypothetical protein